MWCQNLWKDSIVWLSPPVCEGWLVCQQLHYIRSIIYVPVKKILHILEIKPSVIAFAMIKRKKRALRKHIECVGLEGVFRWWQMNEWLRQKWNHFLLFRSWLWTHRLVCRFWFVAHNYWRENLCDPPDKVTATSLPVNVCVHLYVMHPCVLLHVS